MKLSPINARIKERLLSLRELSECVKSADVRNDNEFQSIIRDGQILLEMSDQEMGDALSVSRPTVNRWINGKNLPHPVIRKSIAAFIGKNLAGRIKVVSSAHRAESATSKTQAPSRDLVQV
jgi:transcriptional regulator with XRE-family HTH domain